MNNKNYKNIKKPHNIDFDFDDKPKIKKQELGSITENKIPVIKKPIIKKEVVKQEKPISLKLETNKNIISKNISDTSPNKPEPKVKKSSIFKTVGIILLTIIISLVVIYIVVNFDTLRARATFTRNDVDIIEYSDDQQSLNLKAFTNDEGSLLFVPILLDFPDPEVVEFPEEKKEEEEITEESGSESSSYGTYTVENTLNNQLFIPSLGVSTPIVWDSSVDENSMLASLQNGVAHYLGTAKPGEGLAENTGNVFISGHSSYYSWDPGGYKSIFATLPYINIGDQIAIGYYDKVYVYEVYDKAEVSPDNVDVVRQDTDEHIITLMTCVPVGTNERRLIVRARFVGYAE
jgi:LPXTG-site transpeptidase (sortase) family protein